MEFLKIPESVSRALNALESCGFEAFIVGGCVRDLKLHNEPHDWDITTNALPDEIKMVFKDFKTIDTGLKHGTVTVLISGAPLEITTYRIDGEYFDNRHPAEVTFTRSLSEDLSRRDFTINAIAYNPKMGFVDKFGGEADLHEGVIRAIGDADKRFHEDALRILRALRFAAVLDFEIDNATGQSILENRALLEHVSAERITDELLKLLCGNGKRVTRLLINYRDVFAVVFPKLKLCFDFEQHNKHHIYNVYDHIAYSVGFAIPDSEVRLALLLHDIGKPDCFFTDEDGVGHFYGHGEKSAKIAAEELKRLRLTTKTYETVVELVRYHGYPIEPDRKSVKRRLNKFGPELLTKLLYVRDGDILAHNPVNMRPSSENAQIISMMNDILSAKECFCIKDLALNGDDIMSLGVPEGASVGRMLNDILEEVTDERLPNTKEALTAFAKERINTSGTVKD